MSKEREKKIYMANQWWWWRRLLFCNGTLEKSSKSGKQFASHLSLCNREERPTLQSIWNYGNKSRAFSFLYCVWARVWVRYRNMRQSDCCYSSVLFFFFLFIYRPSTHNNLRELYRMATSTQNHNRMKCDFASFSLHLSAHTIHVKNYRKTFLINCALCAHGPSDLLPQMEIKRIKIKCKKGKELWKKKIDWRKNLKKKLHIHGT